MTFCRCSSSASRRSPPPPSTSGQATLYIGGRAPEKVVRGAPRTSPEVVFLGVFARPFFCCAYGRSGRLVPGVAKEGRVQGLGGEGGGVFAGSAQARENAAAS